MKKLISIILISGAALVSNAQFANIPQYQAINKTVVGVVSPNGGAPTPVAIKGATTVTNSLVSSAALANGAVPPGQGLSWDIPGSTLTTTAPPFVSLFSTITGTSPSPGGSVKQIQGLPYEGGPWVNLLTVSNALPVATNTLTYDNLINPTNFYGYIKGRVFSIQNTSTNAGPSTNNITEQDSILLFH